MAAPTPPASAAASAGGDLLQAFLRGAGMTQLKVDPAGAEAQMEAIGRSYRGLVEGLVDVLRARASLKGEFRMAQTMIQPVQNNPLKFAPNVDEAMLLLLRRDNQAFMAPDRAVADSFEDLKAHQLAVMAGVQAAIRHLLARFEPAALEARFGKPAGLSGLLPGPPGTELGQFHRAVREDPARGGGRLPGAFRPRIQPRLRGTQRSTTAFLTPTNTRRNNVNEDDTMQKPIVALFGLLLAACSSSPPETPPTRVVIWLHAAPNLNPSAAGQGRRCACGCTS